MLSAKLSCLPRVLRTACIVHVRRTYGSSSSSSSPIEDPFLQHSSTPTMHFQASLPRLPVPKLEDTCRRYLTSQEVILNQEELKNTEDAVREFLKEGGQGRVLQELLVQGNKENKHTSYISEAWFDMYLRSRLPLVLNYNPYLAFLPDPQLNNAVDRTANMLHCAARFRNSLRAGNLEPDLFHLNPARSDTNLYRTLTRLTPSAFAWYTSFLFKAFPLDMSQYGNLFNATRVPRLEKDELVTYDSGGNHAVVLRKGHFYKFTVVNEDGSVVHPEQLRLNLQHIQANVDPPPEAALGLATSMDRDEWAALRQELLKEPSNGASLEDIDSALIVVCLEEDDFTRDQAADFSHMMLHGNGINRWFDKSFSLIVTPSGNAAINFEHAWGDGVAVLRFFNEIHKETTTRPYISDGTVPAGMVPQVERLEFKLSAKIKERLSKAKEEFAKFTSSLKIDLLEYATFGKDLLKEQNITPDGVMQLAFQMAFYRAFHFFPATYESCSTAAYKHGRTETLRAGTLETRKAAVAFDPRGGVDAIKKRKLIEEASKKHSALKQEAVMGYGFDRHLFVLKRMADWKEMKLPLFEDPAYAKMNRIILSTSTLSADNVLIGGFAPVVDDGLGVGYNISAQNIGVHLTSYPACRDGEQFLHHVRQCLDEIHEVLTHK